MSSVRSEHCNRLFQDKKKSKSTNQYIPNFVTQECFQKVHYHQALTIGKEANLRKMYLALFVKILVFLTFLPGLFVAGPRSEEEFKKWLLELRVVVLSLATGILIHNKTDFTGSWCRVSLIFVLVF